MGMGSQSIGNCPSIQSDHSICRDLFQSMKAMSTMDLVAYIGENDQIVTQLETLASQTDGPNSQEDYRRGEASKHGHPYG